MALRSIVLISKELQTLLKKNANMLWIRRQEKSNLTPLGGGIGDLFKLKTIMDNWETIPIFITAFLAASCPILHAIWRLINAEDIRLRPGTKLKCHTHRYILEGPPKVTKYMVINDKWEWPEGLLEALKDDKKKEQCEKKPQQVSFKFWKRD